MNKIKISLLAMALISLLFLGSPVPAKAINTYEMPPAVVMVQDKNSRMLLNHNFTGDDGMPVTIGGNVDEGFYVEIG